MMRLNKLRSLAPRFARASAAASVLAFFFATVVVRQVHAEVDDMAVHFGDELSKLPSEQGFSGAIDGDFYRVDVNGAHANVASTITTKDVTSTLNDLFGDCEHHADGMAEDFKDLGHTMMPNAKRAETGAPGFGPVKRQLEDDRGYVVCFAGGKKLGEMEGLTLLREALETGDLTRVGQIRYVTARKQPDGRTFVVAVWTDSSFNVRKMFPKEGDTPGSDPKNIPRPEGSRRLMTASVAGSPVAIRVYELPMTADQAMAYYATELPKAGYPEKVKTDMNEMGRIFATPQTAFYINAKDTQDGKSAVSMTESRMFSTTDAPGH